MKKIYQFKSVLDAALWFSMGLIAITVAVGILGVFFPNTFNFSVHGRRVDYIDVELGILIALLGIGYAIFIYGLFKLKQLTENFVERRFFTVKTIALTKKTGVSLLWAAAFMYVPPFFYEMFADNQFNLMFTSITPESALFLIIIGLFFTTLSFVFEEAHMMKEENDLTV